MKSKLLILISYCSIITVQVFGQVNPAHQVSNPISFVGVSTFGSNSQSLTVTTPPGLDDQNHKVKDAQLYVHLFIDDGKYKLGEELQQLDISFKLQELYGGTVQDDQIINFSLGMVSNNQRVEQVFKYDFTDDFTNGLVDEFTVTDINLSNLQVLSGIPSDVANYINEYITLKAWWEIKYGVDVKTSSLADIPAPNISTKNLNLKTSRVQTFYWNTTEYSPGKKYEFPNYQLQLLKIENEDQNANGTVTATVDWSKALTIETYSHLKEVTITMSEGSGFYLWRVRGIGNFYEGGIADSRNWGNWSSSFQQGQQITFDLNNNSPNEFSSFRFQDPDHDKNWVYSRVFTEEGKTHEGMSYANGLLQPVQTQAYSSEENAVIVSQSVRDHIGREALSSIPVPVENETLDGYKDEFILDATSGELYSAKHFDDDANIDNPELVRDNPGDYYSYYSNNNTTHPYVPDAGGVPYSRTKFMSDGSGRPIEQSGLGTVHAIGTDHTTKIYYGTPSDDELIAIFGDEAPLAENVLKTSTVDPNGTISITYTTIEGKTIATAMSESTPGNLSAIDGSMTLDLVQAEFSTVVNTMDENKFISSKPIVLNADKTVTLSYSVNESDLADNCGAADCQYYVKFRLIDQITGDYYESQSIDLAGNYNSALDFTGVNWVKYGASLADFSAISNVVTSPNNGLEINLSAGYWKFQKVLGSHIDPDNISQPSPVAKLGPLMEIVSGWMADVSNEQEHQDFMNDLATFQQVIADAHTAANGCGDINSTCYQDYFNTIRADYGISDNYIFDPEYTLELPTDGNNETYISFTAACCDPIEVDIPSVPVHEVCEAINDQIDSGTLTPEDIGYTQMFKDYFDELQAEGLIDPAQTFTLEWEDVAPGYTDNLVLNSGTSVWTSDFDNMAYHMLTDQYYTGKAYDDPADGWVTWETKDDASPTVVYPNGDLPTSPDPELYGPHYECNELFNCWYAAMRAYYEMLSLKGQSFNIYDDVNEDDPNNTNDTSGDHYDDDDSKPEGGGFTQWLVDWIISQKMKDFSDDMAGEAGTNDEPGFAYQLNMPDMFLQCSGKKLAAIVSPDYSNELDASYNNNNYEDFADEIVYAKDSIGDPLDPEVLVYPYVVKPEWAFKYIEYWPGIEVNGSAFQPASYSSSDPNYDPSFDPILSGIPSVEISTCYHPIPSGSNPLCYQPPCEGNHHNWSAEEREFFYDRIKFAEEAEFDPTTVSSQNQPDCADYNLAAMKAAKFQAVKDTCAERYSEFRQGIQNMFEINCYQIEVCQTGATNVVTEAELDAMAQNAVTECINYVETIETSCADDINYPSCTTTVCDAWTGTQFVTSYEMEILLFDPNSNIQQKLDNVMYGAFFPALPASASACDTPPTEPTWFSNQQHCDDPESAIDVPGNGN